MVCQLVSEQQEVNQLDDETQKSKGLSDLKMAFPNEMTLSNQKSSEGDQFMSQSQTADKLTAL